jgi:hypothetical protein
LRGAFHEAFKFLKMDNKHFKTILEYFSLGKPFIIPYYQRGYKWSLQDNEDRGKKHLEVLLDDLLNEFLHDATDYFLQGVTVKNRKDSLELVDGQQRTTSIILLLAGLQKRKQDIKLGINGMLMYKVRDKVNEAIQKYINDERTEFDVDDKVQDLYALNKAIEMIEKWLDEIPQQLQEKKKDLKDFTLFLLNNVKLIYIEIDENLKETEVFSDLNQDQAKMSKTDLVKSLLLRETSRQVFKIDKNDSDEIKDGLEWQINQTRSLLAKEWDSWRKWWNDNQHFNFLGEIQVRKEKDNDIEEPRLSGLLKLYWLAYPKENSIYKELKKSNLFEVYSKLVEDIDINKIEALDVFNGLRKIQSILSEWYKNYELYNWLILLFYLKKDDFNTLIVELIKEYAKNRSSFIYFIKRKYKELILSDFENDYEKYCTIFFKSTNEFIDVYHSNYYHAVMQLLRMNVELVNAKKIKFDFLLFEGFTKSEKDDIDNAQTRSLEHIYPQDPKEECKDLYIDYQMTNSIGNLVLLPKGLNSGLQNKCFSEKKEIVFEKILSQDGNIGLWLHTINIFGKYNLWGKEQIKTNQDLFKRSLTKFFKGD